MLFLGCFEKVRLIERSAVSAWSSWVGGEMKPGATENGNSVRIRLQNDRQNGAADHIRTDKLNFT
jgi:hypothetical protein